jgi:hypothetical protein
MKEGGKREKTKRLALKIESLLERRRREKPKTEGRNGYYYNDGGRLVRP